MAANEMPDFIDHSGALLRRFVFLPFNHVPKEVDEDLRRKMENELPGIMNWMIQGLVKLKTRKYRLLEPSIAKEERENFQTTVNPLNDFIQSEVIEDAYQKISYRDMFSRYTSFMEQLGQGNDVLHSSRVFHRAINTALAETKPTVRRSANAINGERWYLGASLTELKRPSELTDNVTNIR
jgi:phage/plasmid-associated DNA primase